MNVGKHTIFHRNQKEKERSKKRRKYFREYSREYRRKHGEKYLLFSPEELIKRRKQFGESRRGEGNPMYGNHHTKKTRKKMSLNQKGEKNFNWRGGITLLVDRIRNSFKYRLWRSDVFTRDDFTCQKCGHRGCYLEAHHKETLSDIMELNDIRTFEQAINCEELWNINNGVTLCEKCHNLTKRGRKKKDEPYGLFS